MSSAVLTFTAYVEGGEMARSVAARLRELCASHGVEPRITVVDVAAEPRAAEDGNGVGVPTVVRESPGPRRRVIGSLEDTRRVADALGLVAHLDGAGGHG